MMLFILAFIITIGGITLLFFISRQKRQFGILGQKKRIYQDTQTLPGEIMYAKSIPLAGKPDYLIKEGKHIIPVEIKTGSTPQHEYVNHNMQLMAYCLLVEENYGKRPPGGIIKYPSKEIRLRYTDVEEKAVRDTVSEIIENKNTNTEFQCNHPEHNQRDFTT